MDLLVCFLMIMLGSHVLGNSYRHRDPTVGDQYRFRNYSCLTCRGNRYDNPPPANIKQRETHVWAWFSLRSFWREEIPPVVKFDCGDADIALTNAYLNVTMIRGAPVVIFAGGFTGDELWRDLRDTRDPSQLWVFNTDESALTTMEYLPPQEYINGLLFNITFTYHTESELSVPYGYYREYQTSDPRRTTEDIDYHRRKPRFAAFISSHCRTIAWSRTEFAKDLAEHIPLDRYGKCGNRPCRHHDQKCTSRLKEYKFILGLENACCEQYITEKFWDPLLTFGSIPVVLGGSKEDYERIGPPNSFIHAGDFGSMEELSAYLKKVANDPVLYNRYFEWKKEGFVRETHENNRRIRFKGAVCRLHEYIQSRAWEEVENRFDVYGERWLGSCGRCIERDWFTNKYAIAPGIFTHN